MAVVIGIDADTRRLAYSCVSDGVVTAVREFGRQTARGYMVPDYDQRLTSLMRSAQVAGAVVYLEDTYLASGEQRNVVAFRALAEVGGEIKRAARQHGVPVVMVSASEWRSVTLGQTCDRERLKLLARQRAVTWAANAMASQDVTELSEHECEAVCIGQFGAEREGDSWRMTPAEHDGRVNA